MKLIDIIYIPKFEPDVEAEFNTHTLKLYAPLLPPTMVIGALVVVAIQFWQLMLFPDALTATMPIALGLLLHLAACIALSLHERSYANIRNWMLFCLFLYIGSAIGLSATLAHVHNGSVAGVGALILGTIAAPAIVRGAKQAIFVLLVYLAVSVTTLNLLGVSRFDINNIIWWVMMSSVLAIFFAQLFDVANRRAYELARQLRDTKKQSDDLLTNLMPRSIADRLIAGEDLIADRHDSVTVLFADVAGFTELSLHLSAKSLVRLLNDLFSKFDAIVEKHGAEKIKIIGDAYMVAGGLFDRSGNHADHLADIALDMQQAVADFREQTGHKLKLRVGMHSGPVIAGVIGKNKLAYDLWGNTVNTANLMENQGLPDEIQITVETRDMLSDSYRTIRRGEISLKGQSPRTTYLLRGTFS